MGFVIGLLKRDGQFAQIPFINLTSLAKALLWALYQMDTRDKSKRSEETIHPSRQVSRECVFNEERLDSTALNSQTP